MNRTDLARKTRGAADQLLRDKGYVSAVEVLMAMGRLSKEDHERWRFRQVPHLEMVLPGSLNQQAFFIRELHAYARARNLKPSRTTYVSWGKGRKQPLRFTKFGEPRLEESYSTHHVASTLTGSRQPEPNATSAASENRFPPNDPTLG